MERQPQPVSEMIACRACANRDLQAVLDLGRTPLANALLAGPQAPERIFPLLLAFCPQCSLAQITETVPAELLFRNYLYYSSFSDTMLQHAGAIVEKIVLSRGLNPQSLVMEVASNDGYLLKHYQQRGIPVLGIEPAANIAQLARDERGIPTLPEFFGRDLALQLCGRGLLADVIHANNVLAHVADLNGFAAGLRLAMKPDGIAVIEVPYVKDMIDHVEFDTIYHEHLSYFSLTALDRLMKSHRLAIQDVERLSIHGGSLRVFAAHQAAGLSPSDAVCGLLEQEEEWGVDRRSFYGGFEAKVQALKRKLLCLLEGLKAQGRRIAAYGASAKGATLLNYCGIDRGTLDFVVDRSTVKQGLFTPGARLPIYPTQKLLEAMPDYALLLTWNFAGEILEQQAEYQRRGGRFIIPIPEPQVLGT